MAELLAQADQALYFAKERGRNRVEVASLEMMLERRRPARRPSGRPRSPPRAPPSAASTHESRYIRRQHWLRANRRCGVTRCRAIAD